jgi:hypothetical protein
MVNILIKFTETTKSRGHKKVKAGGYIPIMLKIALGSNPAVE